MPMIYRRFTEKSAEEWRQIYKALQLLEFLIKHGSERVIDDARSHLTLLKMLRQFHFIDQNGRDQGVNVRNRAKELAELLGDVERIRAERKKARSNKTKYTGVEGGMSSGGGFSSGGSGGSGSGSRYGGFGSESAGPGANYGGYSGGVYGDGGGFGGDSSDFRDASSRRDKFEEYDEFDGDEKPADNAPRAGVKRTTGGAAASAKKAEPPKKKEPEVDLFSFDEPPSQPPPSALAIAPPASSSSGLASLAANDDDEFDDFQSATPSQAAAPMVTSNTAGARFAAPQPVSAPKQANLSGMVGLSSISPPPATTTNYAAFSTPLTAVSPPPPKPSGYQPAGPNYFQSVPLAPAQSSSATTPSTVGMGMGMGMGAAGASAAKPAPSAGGDAFGASGRRPASA